MICRSHRVAGHFGELIQGRLGADGPVVVISLPCPVLTVTAAATPAHRLIIHSPHAPLITAQRARKFLSRLGLTTYRNRVTLSATMPPGGGAGSSSAGLVALARLAGWTGASEPLARACLVVEGATDPLMFDHPERWLWASRRAEVISPLPALPPFDVLGGFYGAPSRTKAADQTFPDVSDLVRDWRRAAKADDLATLAQLAAASAQRTLALRGPSRDPTAQLARDLGALGHVIAHTGSARGLIFARGKVPSYARAAVRQAGFTGVVQVKAGGTQ